MRAAASYQQKPENPKNLEHRAAAATAEVAQVTLKNRDGFRLRKKGENAALAKRLRDVDECRPPSVSERPTMRCRGQRGRRRGGKLMIRRLRVRRGQQGADRGVNYLWNQSRGGGLWAGGRDGGALGGCPRLRRVSG